MVLGPCGDHNTLPLLFPSPPLLSLTPYDFSVSVVFPACPRVTLPFPSPSLSMAFLFLSSPLLNQTTLTQTTLNQTTLNQTTLNQTKSVLLHKQVVVIYQCLVLGVHVICLWSFTAFDHWSMFYQLVIRVIYTHAPDILIYQLEKDGHTEQIDK